MSLRSRLLFVVPIASLSLHDGALVRAGTSAILTAFCPLLACVLGSRRSAIEGVRLPDVSYVYTTLQC